MLARKYQQGVVDILSLFGLVFLVITLVVSTSIVANPDIRQIFNSSADGGRIRSWRDIGNPAARQEARENTEQQAEAAAAQQAAQAAAAAGSLTLNQITGNTGNAFVTAEDQTISNTLTNFLANWNANNNNDDSSQDTSVNTAVTETATQETQNTVNVPPPSTETTSSVGTATLNELIGQPSGSNPFVAPNQEEINQQIDQRFEELENQSTVPLVSLSSLNSPETPFSKPLDSACDFNSDCGSGKCGTKSVISLNKTCVPNDTPIGNGTENISCQEGTIKECLGPYCSCITPEQKVNLETGAIAASDPLSPEFANTIPENFVAEIKNLNNYPICAGDQNCNLILTGTENGLNLGTGGKFENYITAFQQPYQVWQQEGYESADAYIKDCVERNGLQAGYGCMKTATSLTREAAIASVDLGTTLTAEGAAIAALPAILTAGSFAGGATAALGSLGAITTLNQTGNTVIACAEGNECGKNVFFTVLSWANLGTADLISSAFTSGATEAIRIAQITNTGISAANLITDLGQTNEGCFGENANGANCAFAVGSIIFDVGGGALDLNSGQLIFGNTPPTSVVDDLARAVPGQNTVQNNLEEVLDTVFDPTTQTYIPVGNVAPLRLDTDTPDLNETRIAIPDEIALLQPASNISNPSESVTSQFSQLNVAPQEPTGVANVLNNWWQTNILDSNGILFPKLYDQTPGFTPSQISDVTPTTLLEVSTNTNPQIALNELQEVARVHDITIRPFIEMPENLTSLIPSNAPYFVDDVLTDRTVLYVRGQNVEDLTGGLAVSLNARYGDEFSLEGIPDSYIGSINLASDLPPNPKVDTTVDQIMKEFEGLDSNTKAQIILKQQDDLKTTLTALKESQTIDPLTGILSERGIKFGLEVDTKIANSTGRPLVVVELGLDGFKNVNDTKGHEFGDLVLIKTAEIIKGAAKRDQDMASRILGNNYVLGLPETTKAEADFVIKTMIDNLEAQKLLAPIGDPIHDIKISSEVKEWKPGTSVDDYFSQMKDKIFEKRRTTATQLAVKNFVEKYIVKDGLIFPILRNTNIAQIETPKETVNISRIEAPSEQARLIELQKEIDLLDISSQAQISYRLQQDLAVALDNLKTSQTIDELTGALSKQGTKLALEIETKAADRTNRPLTAVLIDLDKFKEINLNKGRQFGDDVLRETVDFLKTKVREGDLVGRNGGDEMSILFPETNEATARIIMNRALNDLEDVKRLASPDDPISYVSISYGAKEWESGGNIQTFLTTIDEEIAFNKQASKAVGNIPIAIPKLQTPYFFTVTLITGGLALGADYISDGDFDLINLGATTSPIKNLLDSIFNMGQNSSQGINLDDQNTQRTLDTQGILEEVPTSETLEAPLKEGINTNDVEVQSQTLYNNAAEYINYTAPDLRNVEYHVVRIDMDKIDKFVVTPLQDRTTTSNFLNTYNLDIAINGDGWYYYTDEFGNQIREMAGFGASEGNQYGRRNIEQTLYIDKDNNISLQKPPDEEIWNAISFPNLLVQNGVAVPHPEKTDINPRTALGLTRDNVLILITVDGREYSSGVTMQELTNILIEQGAVFAVNFDGGTSSTMAIAGPNGEAVTLNNPDSSNPSGENTVANQLGIEFKP